MMPNESEKNKIEGGTLYLVATPVGNLADLSPRAGKVLGGVDFVAAEDTRNTRRLLAAFGLSRPLLSYHEHNKRERGPEIVARLKSGASCALVSDAGTPAVSDPGADLVALCAAEQIPVTAVPGACAAVLALILSGLPTDRFVFEGFLPVGGKERRQRLAAIATEPRTVLLHEAPHRLLTTLCDLCAVAGETRRVTLCRELTKQNEEIRRTTLGAARDYYEINAPRGEFVLVLEGAAEKSADPAENPRAALSPADHVAYYEREGLSRMEAIKAAARERGMRKSDLYRQLTSGAAASAQDENGEEE